MFRCVQARAPALTRGLRGSLPEVAPSLEQRLSLLGQQDSEIDARVNIGYSVAANQKEKKAESRQKRADIKTVKKNNELRNQCTTGNHKIDLNTVKSIWTQSVFGRHILVTADHYNIFRDLFEYGYFLPVVHMKVGFPISDKECAPVHFGNIIPSTETANVPEIHYEADSDQLFTLVMTSLDSHLEAAGNEYLHWMVGNIPGNDISKGTTICDYLRPFMPKGTGYHRFVFVLYRQEKPMDFSDYQKSPKTTCLRERTFRTIDFYRALENDITPCGLSFFQSDWDDCLVNFFHNELGMKAPVFEHVPLDPVPEKFKKFPEKESFNHYIDRFRDPKEIAEDIYCRRLRKLDPFKEEVPSTKFPHAHPMSLELASWVRAEITMERNFAGKFKHMKRFSLHPEGHKEPYKQVLVKLD